MKQLSLLEESRLEDPGLTDVERVRRLAAGIVEKLGLEPPIDPRIVASFQGIGRIETTASPWAGALLRQDDGFVIRVRESDGRRRRRFTALHEVAHTFLPGFAMQPQYRCNPDPSGSQRIDEILCDAAAAELLLPRHHFSSDLRAGSFDLETIEALSDKYDASLEATSHRFVDLWPEPALLVALELRNKPSEKTVRGAEPKLRVNYARASGDWPFVPRHKSARDPSLLFEALTSGKAQGHSDLDGLALPPREQVECIAVSRAFADANGAIRDRVLAIYRQPTGATRRIKGEP